MAYAFGAKKRLYERKSIAQSWRKIVPVGTLSRQVKIRTAAHGPPFGKPVKALAVADINIVTLLLANIQLARAADFLRRVCDHFAPLRNPADRT